MPSPPTAWPGMCFPILSASKFSHPHSHRQHGQTSRQLGLCCPSSASLSREHSSPAPQAPTEMGPAGMGQLPTAPRVLHGLGKQPGKNRVCSLQCPGPAGQGAPICSQPLSEHRVPRSTSVPGADLRHHEQYKKPCPGVLVLGSAVHRASKLALNLPDHRESQEPAVPKDMGTCSSWGLQARQGAGRAGSAPMQSGPGLGPAPGPMAAGWGGGVHGPRSKS